MNIYIDIETIPTGDKPQITDLKPPGQMKLADTIKKWYADTEARNEDIEEIYRKKALSFTESRVLCLAYAIDDNPVVGIMRNTEKETIEAFRDSLLEYDSSIFDRTNTLLAFNGKQFDFPILFLRAVKYQVKGLVTLFHVPNPFEFHRDVMLEFGLKARGYMISMDNACKFLDIDSPKGDIDGSMIYDYYLGGRTDEILTYCCADVEATRMIWKALNYGGIKTI